MEKRGQASIITIVLIILLILAGIVVVWNVVFPLIQKSSEQTRADVESMNTRVEISSVKSYTSAGQKKVDIEVQRSAGGTASISSLRFLIYYKDGAMANFTNTTTLNPLETKVFTFDIDNSKDVEKVLIIPFDSNNQAGMESTNSNVIEQGCIPLSCAQIGKQCGTWPNQCGGNVNCPACSSGYNCNSTGQCVAVVVCVDNDNDGYNQSASDCGIADCNDSDANIYPNAIETCNAVDDDCDGQTDEGCGGGNLVAYYAFEGNADDASGNGNNGVVNGALPTTGIKGNAYSFDGVNDYISTFSKSFSTLTVCAWARSTGASSTTGQAIVSASAWTGFYMYYIVSSGVRFGVNNGQETGYYNEATPSNWHYYCGVYNGTNVILYDDATLRNTAAASGATANSLIKIGYGVGGSDGYFNGTIDEVKIWNYSLSQTEILNEYNSVNQKKLVAYYAFEGNADDASGNGNNGVVYNASLVSGRIGQAYSFSGINSNNGMIKIPKALAPNGTNGSYSIWVYVNPDSRAYELMLAQETSSKNYCMALGYSISSNTIGVHSNNGAVRSGPSYVYDLRGKWTHVLATWNNTNSTLYINGQNVKTGSSGGCPGSIVQGFYIGNGPYSVSTYDFNGTIDEVKIWNYSLSQTEILNEYNRIS